MNWWITLSLVALLGLAAAGLDPAWLHTPWSGLGSAFYPSHPLFLVMLALVLMLAGVPVEVRLGRGALLAAWSLPQIFTFWIYGRAWPELAALALLVSFLTASLLKRQAVPWKIWVPLLFSQALMLWALQPSLPTVLLSLSTGLVVGRWSSSEVVKISGWAGGGALLLAWLS